MENILQLTEQNLDEVLEKNRLIVIDFKAEWCGPCKSFAKVIEKVAPSYPEFIFATVDIDAEKSLAEEFEVQSIPLVMILRDRVVVFMEAGALSESALKNLLNQTKELNPNLLKSE